MKYEIVKEFPNDIIFEREGPCISIYQPTHRHLPENQQDPVRFKQLLTIVEKALLEEISRSEMEKILKPLYDLQKDYEFWNNTKDGIAIFLNKNKCIIYNLNRTLKEVAIVSDSFHIKPLIRVFQSADSYYVLGISMKKYNLYIGNRYGLEEVLFDENIPTTIEGVLDELGDAYEDGSLSFGSFAGSTGNAIYYGQGGKKDEVLKYTEKFFKYVDRFVINNYTKPTGFPLILVALDENQGVFRKLTHNDNLLKKGVKIDYEALDVKELNKKSWEIMEEYYLAKTKEVVDRYNNSLGTGLSSDKLEDISKAAVNGKVETILIESDKVIPGFINLGTGDLEVEEEKVGANDILNNLAEIVFSNNGEVIMLPKEKMPSDTGVVAIYRF